MCILLGGGRDNGTVIQIWNNPEHVDSQFLIQNLGDNVYAIRNIGNGLVVNAKGNNKDKGTVVQVWNNPDAPASQWTIELFDPDQFPGIYTIQNVNAPEQYLNCKGNGRNNGTPVQLWNNPQDTSTQWYLYDLSKANDAKKVS